MIDLKNIIETSSSKAEVCRKLKWPNNGKSCKKIDQFIIDNKLDVDFKKIIKNFKYKLIEKSCPICNNTFTTQKDHTKEKITCSSSCANTYFRSGDNNPNYKNGNGKSPDASYRKICFKYHKKECVVCGENIVVEVHHYDGDHQNNNPNNLVPICPTHHRYWHSKHRMIIKNKIDKYILNFKNEHR